MYVQKCEVFEVTFLILKKMKDGCENHRDLGQEVSTCLAIATHSEQQ